VDTERGINNAIRKIRIALQDSPDEPTQLQTVVGKGYRFIGHLEVAGGSADLRQDKAPDVSATATLRSQSGTKWESQRLVISAAIAVAIVILAVGLALWRSRAGGSRAAIHSLAVLPLENLSGDPAQDYFADGMTDALIARLSAIHGLRVISRTSVMQFKGTRKRVSAIARDLNVDALVEGSVLRSGDQIRISVQLIRADTDEHLWSRTDDRELRDVLALQSQVAQGIASQIEATVTGRQANRLVAARAVSPDVYESYLKGRFAFHKNNRAGLEEALRHFQTAVDADATFAPAYAGLAATYDALGAVFYGEPPSQARQKTLAAARKALELDPELAEARVLLASALQNDWHWAEAEAEYKRAIELSPSDAGAHAGLADWLLCQGRTGEALVWARRAQELDPLTFDGTQIGWILFHARRYDEAIRELRTALTLEPEDPSTLWFLGFALTGANQFDEAIQVLEKAASVSDRSSAVLGVLVRAYARAGRRTEALRILDELHRRRQTGYVPAAAFLNAYLGLGDTEMAFAWLERSAEEHSDIMQLLKVHPFFDSLRGDPRFAAFLHRANFQ